MWNLAFEKRNEIQQLVLLRTGHDHDHVPFLLLFRAGRITKPMLATRVKCAEKCGSKLP
jgi:hypothetical protein